MVCTYEQRNSQRTPVAWPVSVWHPQVLRFYNGSSVNVSDHGALIILPLKTPIREGQSLEINFPRAEPLAKQKGRFARIKRALITRIDRSDSLKTATVKVGMKFCDKATK